MKEILILGIAMYGLWVADSSSHPSNGDINWKGVLAGGFLVIAALGLSVLC